MILLPDCPCCCNGCKCGATIPTTGDNSPQFLITLTGGGSFPVCLNAMPSGSPSDAPQLLRCGPGDDTEFPARSCLYYLVWYDGTCVHRIYFSIAGFPECDCETGDGCEYVIEGWENYTAGCPYSIASIEITSVGEC